MRREIAECRRHRSALPIGVIVGDEPELVFHSFRRRMPARRDPCPANRHRNHVVELQSSNRRASARRQSQDSEAIFAPCKVLFPALVSGVEQPYRLTGRGIRTMHPCAFEPIAEPAGEPEIVLLARATQGAGNDMINLQQTENIPLLALTVSAAISADGLNAGADFSGEPLAAHGVNGSRRPRRKASASACALRSSPS